MISKRELTGKMSHGVGRILKAQTVFLQVFGLRAGGNQQEQESQCHGGVTQPRLRETHNPQVGMLSCTRRDIRDRQIILILIR